jgi:signal transduction histidine kinase
MDKARFMGRMAATVSHDLCNVLATIQQASGLLGDYLALSRKEQLKSMGLRPKFKYNDKFEEIIAQVQAQVNRGQDMCDQLSRLAHSPDEGQDFADLAQAVELLVKLSTRVAKKHKVRLLVMPAPMCCRAQANLVEVLAALEAGLLGVAWECRESQADIVFAPGEGDGCVHVDILCQALGQGNCESLAGSLCSDGSGPYRAEAVHGGVRLVFRQAGCQA